LSVKVSRISRTAALLIIAIGLFTLVVGLASAYLEDTVAGIAFVALGVFLYGLLFRFTRKVEREIAAEDSA
jgi:membrane protein implicated in regulation of membrane protease activity